MDTMPGMDMPMPDQNADAEGPAIGLHGMLIVGEETIYVSHLPMWMQPHNFQVILEVTFAGPDQPQARYVVDRKTTGTRLYTLNPRQQWDIRELAPAGPQRLPSRLSFRATIWRNHFEFHPVTHPGQRFKMLRFTLKTSCSFKSFIGRDRGYKTWSTGSLARGRSCFWLT